MPIFRGQEFVTTITDRKDSVRLATTSNINLSSNSVTTMDGVALSHNDRVLLAGQTSGNQNGIYVWSSTTKQFRRSRDADSNIEVTPGLRVYVEEGNTNSHADFVLSNIGTITLGVTSLIFTKTSAIVTLSNDGQFGTSNKSSVITVNKQGQVTAVSDTPIYITNTNLEFDSISINGSEIPLGAEATFDTDDWGEGSTNLYYTDGRARSAISVSGDLSYNSTTGVISYTAGETLPTQTGNTGKYLTTDGTTASWAQVNFASTLDQLTDVDTTGVSDNYTLVYNSSSSTWLAEQSVADGTIIDGGSLDGLSGGSGITTISDVHNIDELADVIVTNPSNGQVLKWNGSAWVNAADATGGTTINSTDDVSEGSTNLYYTDARVRTSISVNGDLSYNNSTGVISYTAPTLATVATSGDYADLTNKPTIPANIDDLSDIDTTTAAPTDGQTLVWDDANSKWVPGTISGGTTTGKAIAMAIIFGG